MSRVERLLRLAGLLRAGRPVPARVLGERLGVSRRTLYRDLADLQYRGLPIEGRPGLGFQLRAGERLAPLMLTGLEAQALVTAARIGRLELGPDAAQAAAGALERVLACLPAPRLQAVRSLQVMAPPLCPEPGGRRARLWLGLAAAQGRRVRLGFRDAAEIRSLRTVQPRECFLAGPGVWVLRAWCERRGAVLDFRLDRIESLAWVPEELPAS